MTDNRQQLIKKRYTCNVLNCGNGLCVHKTLNETCPICGYNLVQVTTTLFKFCSNHPLSCDFEVDP